MRDQSQPHLPLPGHLPVFAQCFKSFTRQLAAIEQCQRQVFSQPRISSNGDKSFCRVIVNQTLQIGIGRQKRLLCRRLRPDSRRLRLFRGFLMAFYLV